MSQPLASSAITILNSYSTKQGLIFKLPTSTNGVNKILASWIKKAELDKHITYYCSRHSFAVMLLEESNTNLKTVADCLGHASTEHTIKYLNYVNKAKKKALSDLPEL